MVVLSSYGELGQFSPVMIRREVSLKGFPKPIELFTVHPAHETGEHGIVER